MNGNIICVNNKLFHLAQLFKMTNASFCKQFFCWIGCNCTISCWSCLCAVHHFLRVTPQKNRVTLKEIDQCADGHTIYPHPIQQPYKNSLISRWNRLCAPSFIDSTCHLYTVDELKEQCLTSLNSYKVLIFRVRQKNVHTQFNERKLYVV